MRDQRRQPDGCYGQAHRWTQIGLVVALHQEGKARRMCDRCHRWEAWTQTGWQPQYGGVLMSGWHIVREEKMDYTPHDYTHRSTS